MRSKFIPFSDLVQISPDGEYVLLNPRVISLPERKFSDLRDFIQFAFENYELLSPLYPLKAENGNGPAELH